MTTAESVLTVPAIDLVVTASAMCEYEASTGNGTGMVWVFKDGSKLTYDRATREFKAE